MEHKRTFLIIGAIIVIIAIFAILSQKNDAPEAPAVNEAQVVQEYVTQNIVSIAGTQGVLGGTWYVVSGTVNSENNTGTVVYEDGHVQNTANFTYDIDDNGQVTIKSFQNVQQ